MPELPEVETIVRQLHSMLIGETITALSAHWPKTLELFNHHVHEIENQNITAIERRGKWILLRLHGPLLLAIHLRMTGRLLLSQTEQNESHLRVTLNFKSGRTLYFYDSRKFGRIRLVDPAKDDWLGKLGVEPLQGTKLEEALLSQNSRRAVKTALLDQRLVAGIGNIYADEALFLAGIHPLTPLSSLTKKQCNRLAKSVREILFQAIDRGGSTIADYRSLNGETGEQQFHHRVYQRSSLPCVDCQNTIERLVIGGRSSHYCPSCQPRLKAQPNFE